MQEKELKRLGFPKGKLLQDALKAARRAEKAGLPREEVLLALGELAQDPEAWLDDPRFGWLAGRMLVKTRARSGYAERKKPAPYAVFGRDLDPAAVGQMENACRLPVAVAGALLPDAHVGYGLPIGGVLAAKNAVIPWAVGMDIACRMRLTVLDMDVELLASEKPALIDALQAGTRFGVGGAFTPPLDHPVMAEDWGVSPVTSRLREKAHGQLGTSGGGNHFAELGVLEVTAEGLGVEPGRYAALVSHSGSRGVGGEVAQYYSKMARELHPGLPRELSHLAWLELDSPEGRQYWAAMELMGAYSHANHELIHERVQALLGAPGLGVVENHHNFAWIERHRGREVVVHRKGATPAHAGDLGVVPGSMASPAYVVRGLGNEDALCSASHGAGRRMSRRAARKAFAWKDVEAALREAGVTLVSAGLDEAPMAYKDIRKIMAAQQDLVEVVAEFAPRIVKMAPDKK